MFVVSQKVTGVNHSAIGIVMSALPANLKIQEPQYKIAWDCSTVDEAKGLLDVDFADENHSELIIVL